MWSHRAIADLTTKKVIYASYRTFLGALLRSPLQCRHEVVNYPSHQLEGVGRMFLDIPRLTGSEALTAPAANPAVRLAPGRMQPGSQVPT